MLGLAMKRNQKKNEKHDSTNQQSHVIILKFTYDTGHLQKTYLESVISVILLTVQTNVRRLESVRDWVCEWTCEPTAGPMESTTYIFGAVWGLAIGFDSYLCLFSLICWTCSGFGLMVMLCKWIGPSLLVYFRYGPDRIEIFLAVLLGYYSKILKQVMFVTLSGERTLSSPSLE